MTTSADQRLSLIRRYLEALILEIESSLLPPKKAPLLDALRALSTLANPLDTPDQSGQTADTKDQQNG